MSKRMNSSTKALMWVDLMSTSVTSTALLKANLLLYSKCLRLEHPKLLQSQARNKKALAICLQETHMDNAGFKIATIILKSQPKSITVLTMNGSPHCIQLHFAVEQARQLTGYSGQVEHFVVEKGELFKVSPEAIKQARHLASVQQLLEAKVNSSVGGRQGKAY